MTRKWILGALGAAAVIIALAAYHLHVLKDGEAHYKGLLDGTTKAGKRGHYDAIFRLPHPWNPWRDKARRWFAEEGHEWEFLGIDASARKARPVE